MNCPLCEGRSLSLYLKKKKCGREYYKCANCDFIFLSSDFFVDFATEHEHYKKHNNDIYDEQYQAFVMPLVNLLLKYTNSNMLGLDYGCGPGPVVSHILQKQAYRIHFYDLFFCDDKSKLEIQYDFIILSEVAEHFQRPLDSFGQLRNLLKPGGKIFVMTGLTDQIKDFSLWYYHRDVTHVSFYSSSNLALLCEKVGLDLIESDKQKCLVLQAKQSD